MNFHIQWIELGFNAMFEVTNTNTGNKAIYRTHIFPFISDTTSFTFPIGFPDGSPVLGCMTNFSNGYKSCDYSAVIARAADFSVLAR